MTIYIILILLLIMLDLFLSLAFPCKQRQKLLIGISFILVFLISALRHVSVGNDVCRYLEFFRSIASVDLHEMPWFRYELGYMAMNKLLAAFIHNEQVFLAVMAAIILIPIFIGIYKHSPMPFLSVYLFITMGFFAFTLSGFRQAIAMGILFLSLPLIKQRKLLWFMVLVGLASLFHKTSIMFLLAYPIAHMRITPRYLIRAAVLFCVLYFSKRHLLHYVTMKFLPEYQSMLVSSNSITLMTVIFLVFIAGLFYMGNVLKKDPQNIVLYNLILCAAFMQLFATESNNFARITDYFYIFAIIFIPTVLKGIASRSDFMIGCILVVSLTFIQFIWLTPSSQLMIVPYRFFWQ